MHIYTYIYLYIYIYIYVFKYIYICTYICLYIYTYIHIYLQVQPTSTMPCSPEHGPFDVVMILCTLSAIPGNDDAAVLRSAASFLRPGGAVLIRDHGLFDMRHLKDMQRDAVMIDHVRPAYLRPGGMHRRYYSLPNLEQLAHSAGLTVEENRYLCIRQHNRKKKMHMDRVYVHAVFRKGAVDASFKAQSENNQSSQPAPPQSPSGAMQESWSGHIQGGTCPAAAAYVNAIRSCGTDSWAALDILNDMSRNLGGRDMFAVSTALSVCGKSGDWQQAMALFNSIPEADRDLVSYHTALRYVK